MRPICVQCQCELQKVKSGVGAVEMTGVLPYRLWSADLYQCPGCGTQIVQDFGNKPISERFDATFTEYINSYTHRGIIYYNYEKSVPMSARKTGGS